MLEGKKIVIGVTGSIAAYKIPLLVRLLIKNGARVKIMMTEAAVDFVTPLTLSTLSGEPVLINPFNPETGEWNSHVELGQWADLFVLAPLSANTMAKMATGITDNFFMAAYLSAKCPVMFAPAMDLDMYRHPSTARNVEILKSYGNILIAPAVGELASGLCGEGRMEEPDGLFQQIIDFFTQEQNLAGKKVLVTAGPTHEPIDPVRFIGNYSSGKMGFSLAESCALRGAEVNLITGPVKLNTGHASVNRINVVTAREMFDEVEKLSPHMDVIIMAAAVADYAPSDPSASKIKKGEEHLDLSLVKTRDILLSLGKKKKGEQFLVGFALETDNEIENARVKLGSKNLDMIVLNSLRDEGAGFETDTNKVVVLDKDGSSWESGLKSKKEVADAIVEYIGNKLK